LELPNGSNLGCLRNNRNIAAALGYSSDNVQYIVNGSIASDDVVLSEGDLVSVQNRSHEKAGFFRRAIWFLSRIVPTKKALA
jgi:hypothetical protein